VVVLLLAAASMACGHAKEPEGQPKPALDVGVATATLRDFPDTHEAGGVIQARVSAAVTSRMMAPVSQVRVSPGDRVRAGQVLVVLDDRDLSANLRRARASVAAIEEGARAARAERDAAQAALALAQSTATRVTALHDRKSATAQELDEANAAVRGARARVGGSEARVAEAEAALGATQAGAEAAAVQASWATVTAPFDGIVTEKLIEPGNMAAPGTPLVRLESAGDLRVDVRLDESRVGRIVQGQRVSVVVEDAANGERTVEGTVTEIARAVDADSRAFLVKIALDEAAGLRTGMFARVRLAGPARKALSVPASAIVRRGQMATVFAIEKDTARLRLVQTGRAAGDQVEVLAGLEEGEAVVAAPPAGLVDGQPVRVSGSRAPATAAPARPEGTR
jgi:RND family efflux transporter MFP subunit